VANLVVMLMFVFKEWPIEAELRLLRSGQGVYGGNPQFGGYAAPAPWTQPAPQPYGYPPADGGPQAPGAAPYYGPQG
jgi:hypothetical protein